MKWISQYIKANFSAFFFLNEKCHVDFNEPHRARTGRNYLLVERSTKRRWFELLIYNYRWWEFWSIIIGVVQMTAQKYIDFFFFFLRHMQTHDSSRSRMLSNRKMILFMDDSFLRQMEGSIYECLKKISLKNVWLSDWFVCLTFNQSKNFQSILKKNVCISERVFSIKV